MFMEQKKITIFKTQNVYFIYNAGIKERACADFLVTHYRKSYRGNKGELDIFISCHRTVIWIYIFAVPCTMPRDSTFESVSWSPTTKETKWIIARKMNYVFILLLIRFPKYNNYKFHEKDLFSVSILNIR